MFGWEFPPHNSGGLGVACLGLTRAMSAENIELLFVLPKRVELESPDMNFVFADIPDMSEKCSVTPITIDSPLSPYLNHRSYLDQFSKGQVPKQYGNNLIAEVHRYASVGGEIARQQDFDIIHAHDWLTYGAGIAAKEATGKPLVLHIHATEVDRSGGNGLNEEIYELEKAGFEAADLVVAVSEFTRQTLINRYGINPDKVTVVHNGIDIHSTPITDQTHAVIDKYKAQGYKMVLYLGRITVQKSPDNFIRAAKLVLDYNPKVIFVMVGAGDMEGEVIQLASDLNISDKVLFPGFLRGEEKAQMFHSADLFVMPSASEPFGLVPLESMINGTPVLISKQSGVSEVIKHGLKVDFWDVEEMANKILAVLTHGTLQQELTDRGKEEVNEVSWSKAAIKLKQIYHTFLHT